MVQRSFMNLSKSVRPLGPYRNSNPLAGISRGGKPTPDLAGQGAIPFVGEYSHDPQSIGPPGQIIGWPGVALVGIPCFPRARDVRSWARLLRSPSPALKQAPA